MRKKLLLRKNKTKMMVFRLSTEQTTCEGESNTGAARVKIKI